MICRTCKTEKPARSFYRNARSGRESSCKACRDAAVDPVARARYLQSEARRKAQYLRCKRDRAKHPGKWLARRAVYRAVRSGRLVRQPCRCGSTVRVQAHHRDYRRQLDVEWLCEICHKAAHTESDQ